MRSGTSTTSCRPTQTSMLFTQHNAAHWALWPVHMNSHPQHIIQLWLDFSCKAGILEPHVLLHGLSTGMALVQRLGSDWSFPGNNADASGLHSGVHAFAPKPLPCRWHQRSVMEAVQAGRDPLMGNLQTAAFTGLQHHVFDRL